MISGPGAVDVFRLDVGEGQQVVDAAHGMACDELDEHVGKIGVRIDVVILQVAISDARTAQCWPPPSEPANR